MNKLNRISIKNKIIFATCIALLFSLSATTLINNYQVKQLMLKQVEEQQLPTALAVIRKAIESDINLPVQAANQLASNVFIQNWIINGEPDSRRAEVLSQLDSLARMENVNGTFLVSMKGLHDYRSGEGLRGAVSADDPAYSWLYNQLRTGEAVNLTFDTGQEGQERLFINNLTTKNGEPLSFSGMAIDLSQLSDMLRQYKLGETGGVYLVSQQGEIRIQPETGIMKNQLPASLTSTLLNQQEFSLDKLNTDQGTHLIASSYLPIIDLYIVAEISENELYRAFDAVTEKNILINIVLAVLFTLLAAFLAAKIVTPIRNVAHLMRDIGEGEGDLNQRLEIKGNDEITELSIGFNSFIEKIHDSIKEVSQVSTELVTSIENTKQLSEGAGNIVEDQKEQTTQIATAINEMGTTISEMARNASIAADSAQQGNNEVSNGIDIVQSNIDSMSALSRNVNSASSVIANLAHQTGKIGAIIDVINGISDQINLLALNAAIEAARAGDHGRGFAVVADEVRSLAHRTNQSTLEIQEMITQLQQGTKEAVDVMDEGQSSSKLSLELAGKIGSSLAAIQQTISTINDINTQVATATEEQNAVVSDIGRNIEKISEQSYQTSDASSQTIEACHQLNALSGRLKNLIGQFKI